MVLINGNDLTLEAFIRVVRHNEKIEIDKSAIDKINRAHQKIEHIIESNHIVYGINTGFGKLSDVIIPKHDLSKLQENLLKSHACGVGPYFETEVVRGIMLLRINALAKGFSGIRLRVVNQLIDYLNHHITPAIPEQGSLGASGDLAPLAHMALTIIGDGEVFYQGKLMPTFEALKMTNLSKVESLGAKEGLSLINGTQAMASLGAIILNDAFHLLKMADSISALSLEALLGIKEAYDDDIHQARGQIGQIITAKNIRNLTKNSTYLTLQGEVRVQDAYSLRCIPQVHGATRDLLGYAKAKIEIEMNAATDNPLIFGDEKVLSGGNFHGQPLALVLDFMKIAIAELANISERRIERLVNPQLSSGLPPFLVAHPGLNSGFMIVQYAAASLVSENKVLAHPASVDSIPSSANQEDHVSMGTISARGCRDILRNSERVLAMELLSSCQAIDLREKLALGEGTKELYLFVRKEIPFLENDTIMYPYINTCFEILKNPNLLSLIEQKVGKLE